MRWKPHVRFGGRAEETDQHERLALRLGPTPTRADCRLGPADEAPISAKRAQAVLDVARVALEHIDGPPAAGADRYMVHLIIQDGHAFMLDGTPIDDEVANRMACDASTVTHLVGKNGEPLALGRKTRDWSTAQRRAIMIRDAGTCRFPGCTHRIYVDVHHHHWWSRGGLTDVDNGYVACSFHHGLIHKRGYLVEGEPNGVLTFYRPNGMLIGSTTPRPASGFTRPARPAGARPV